MIVRFAVDPTALDEDFKDIEYLRWNAHKSVLDYLQTVGAIVLDPGSDSNPVTMLAAVERLPQELKTMWKAKLGKCRRVRVGCWGPSNLAALEEPEHLKSLPEWLDVVYLEHTRAVFVGLDDAMPYLQNANQPEIDRFQTPSSSARFSSAVSKKATRVPQSNSQASVYKDHFKLLCQLDLDFISIVDRFALRHTDGICNFFKCLINDAQGLHVRIIAARECLWKDQEYKFSGADKKAKVDAVVGELRARLKILLNSTPGKVRSVELAVPRKAWTATSNDDGEHGRYIRFGDDCLTIDIGLEIFEQDPCRPTDLSFQTGEANTADKRRAENSLLADSETFDLFPIQ